MNTSTEPRPCPACSAAIPVDAPHGLCPKCLLLGIASTAEPPSNSGGFDANIASPPTAFRPQAGAARDNRLNPPSIEELSAAFPQLEIIELIGRGGMGFVYKARQPKLDRLVALKILPGYLAQEPSFHERFEREARVLAKLQHSQIVAVYDFGEAPTVVRSLRRPDAESRSDEAGAEPSSPDALHSEAGPSFFYLLLEYVDGVNLREAMRAGRFTPNQALAIVPQVCEALQYAHSKGVLHRDIKPENILLDTEGRVKIADFGIAKVLAPNRQDADDEQLPAGASESEMAVTRLTATGSVLGTPLYMAPEQLINPNSVDHRADIFSLGVVFYEMLTGELPMGRFAAPSEKALANQSIDQRIDDIVLKALAKEKELRQQSAGEMKTEVETVASQTKERHAKHRDFAQGGSHPDHPNVRTDERSNRFVTESEPRGNTSGNGGWLALAALMVGTPLAMLPFITFLRSSGPPPHLSGEWIAFATLMMVVCTIGGTLFPIWLGWRHLIGQQRDRSRNGIIPAMIAAYFLALCSANLVVAVFAVRWVADNSDQFAWFARYVGTLVCLAFDSAVLHATWCWATHSSPIWRRHRQCRPVAVVARTASRRWLVLTQPLLNATMTVLSVVSVVLLYHWLVPRWGTSVGPAPRAVVSEFNVIKHVTSEPGSAVDNPHGQVQPVLPPAAAVTSAAAQEAKRLGLILVAETTGDTVHGVPLALTGRNGQVVVEPHFSALVELSQPTNQLSWSNQGSFLHAKSPYPCDYIACDWTADESKPVILGYIRSPGAYDFRADAETSKQLSLASSGSRAELAAGAWKLVQRSLKQSSATESDWQQATQAAHVRMKFVPKAISKLEVPDECLVVLTEDSRTVFTREGGRFTKWELPKPESIRELREICLRNANSEQVAPANVLLLKAHRAVRQQNWEELLNCLTDDGRSEWMLEITSGCELALAQLQARGNVTEPKSLAAMSTLMQLQQELKKFKHELEPLEATRLDLRFKSYSTLSAAERRQFRIDVFQASYDLPGKFGDYYESRVRLPSTILAFVQQLNESQLVIDLSTVSDLHVEDDRATGTWMTTDGKRTPITLRRVKGHNNTLTWMIDSLIGKSVLDAPFPGVLIPGEWMLEPTAPHPNDDHPADATAPANGLHSGSDASQ